ncbi:MAG: hypothetical protein M1826_004873 [Phylliscum demangeonii]|nr:MAG: hypothetical protein M1826_004873 [Phylliscum demangeonii]
MHSPSVILLLSWALVPALAVPTHAMPAGLARRQVAAAAAMEQEIEMMKGSTMFRDMDKMGLEARRALHAFGQHLPHWQHATKAGVQHQHQHVVAADAGPVVPHAPVGAGHLGPMVPHAAVGLTAAEEEFRYKTPDGREHVFPLHGPSVSHISEAEEEKEMATAKGRSRWCDRCVNELMDVVHRQYFGVHGDLDQIADHCTRQLWARSGSTAHTCTIELIRGTLLAQPALNGKVG